MTKKSVLATPKGQTIKLADGKEHTLAPFDLNTLANLEEEFDCDMGELQEKLTKRTATSFRKLLFVLLDDPNMTLQDVGKLVEMKAVGEVVENLTAALSELSV